MSGAVVTVGTFDGMHRGHQAVVAAVLARARERGLESVLVTFDPHPLEVVNPAAAPKLLTPLEEKRALLARTAIDRIVVLPFTSAVARLDAAPFVAKLRAEQGMQELVLGYDHGFGRGRAGDVDLVRRLAAEQGFGVAVVPAVRDEAVGQPISSTLIRTAVAHGDLDAAARWLGRPYALLAAVVPGARRGRAIGVPTINLAPPDPRKLLPPDGVYAVWVQVGMGEAGSGKRYGGMMNQGPRPTFGEAERALEVHLFDFGGELYGQTVQIDWVRRLRDVQAFPSRDLLIAQLERDRQAARASLNLGETR